MVSRRDMFAALVGVWSSTTRRLHAAATTTTRPYTSNGVAFDTLQAAFNAATPGAIVQAAGTIRGDPAVLRTPNVTLRGPATLDARGAHAEGKALIVVKVPGFVAEQIEALNLAVPSGNGAFIRMEADGDLTLRRCHVHDGQQGILTGNNLAMGRVLLENCVFERLGDGSGETHNIYIGQIAELRIRGGRYNDAIIGHCIKSRAARTIIDGAQIHEGRASRAIDLPNGGVVEIANCDILQTQATDNSNIIGYGMEGKFWPKNTFHFYASNRITNARTPPGEVFSFRFEPDVKVIENYTTGKAAPAAPLTKTLLFVPRRDGSGAVTNWGELPLNTWAEVEGTKMEQVQSLIRRDFVDFGAQKFRAICDDHGGAAFDSDRSHLLVRNLGRSGTNNNGTYRLNFGTMRWDVADQPSVITRQEIDETHAFQIARRKAQLMAKGMAREAAEAKAQYRWVAELGDTYNGEDAYKDGKPAGSLSFGKIVWLARRKRMLISIRDYWELEIGRGWTRRGVALGDVLGGALIEDSVTGHVFHAMAQDRDNWSIHEWDPESGMYVKHHTLGLKPTSRHHFYWNMSPCLVGRDLFVLNPQQISIFAFNLDTKTARAIELDQFPRITKGRTCVANGHKVLVLVDTGELWEIDPMLATCTRFAAQGAFGAHPVNGMYGRARVWNRLLVVVPTTYENVRVMRLQSA